MIERELYIKVLDCLHDEQCLAKKVQMIQERDFQVIGNVIINMLLEEIAEVDITQIKQIICMNLRYSQEQYSRLTYEELCIYFTISPVILPSAKEQEKADSEMLQLPIGIFLTCIMLANRFYPMKNPHLFYI